MFDSAGSPHRPTQPIFSHRPVYTYVKLSGGCDWLNLCDVTFLPRPMGGQRFAHGPKAFSDHCRGSPVRARCSQVCQYPPTQTKVNIILFLQSAILISVPFSKFLPKSREFFLENFWQCVCGIENYCSNLFLKAAILIFLFNGNR